jgi:hypothetical protein
VTRGSDLAADPIPSSGHAGGALRGWTPVRITDAEDPVVRWCYTQGISFNDPFFNDPFFDDTLRRARREPFRALFWRDTGIEGLTRFARERPVEVAGIVFHVSRCGSTLVAQMLAALDGVLVMSEPPPLDDLLRPVRDHPDRDDGRVATWIASLAAALGQTGDGRTCRLVLKVDAWAVLQWPLLRAAFPEVPFAFLYRDPAPVLMSHLGRRGFHMVPGTLPAHLLGMEPGDEHRLGPEDYGGQVLGRLYGCGLELARHDGSLLVHHDSPPGGAARAIATRFGLDPGGFARARWDVVAARDAKNPWLPFDASGSRPPSDSVRAACARQVDDVYRELEMMRRSPT